MNYKYKYLKYKSKYFNLKGGNNSNELLDSDTRKFVDSLKGTTPIYKLNPIEARNVLDKLQSDTTYKSNVDIEDVEINSDLSITFFRPRNNQTDLFPVIYFHGGGWVLGNKQTHGRFVSELAVRANVVIVFVNYTPAPDAKYPIQLNQCLQATKYILTNGSKHKINTNKIILAGDSVGGNIVAVTSLELSKEIDMKNFYQILLYPVTDASMSTESHQKYAEGPWLTKKGMEWFFDEYLSSRDDRSDYKISPLNATIEQLRILPSGLLIVDENDILRDEGEAYAHKLINAGVKLTAVRFLGTIHDFLMLDPLKDTPAVVSAIDLIVDSIKKFLD